MEQFLGTVKIVILLLNDFNALKLSDLSEGKNDVKSELFGTHGHEHECNRLSDLVDAGGNSGSFLIQMYL